MPRWDKCPLTGSDVLVASGYLAGGIIMLFPETGDAASQMYTGGSINILIRSSIRVTRLLHLLEVRHTRSGLRRVMPDRSRSRE